MTQAGLTFDADQFPWVAKVLLSGDLLLFGFVDRLIDSLLFFCDFLLFLWLPLDGARVIELLVVEVVGNGEE